MERIKSAFSVDFEDWYQGFEIIPFETWENYESRVERNCDHILALLNEFKVKGTFFMLGYLVDKFPHVVKSIHSEGHELGSHGYSHTQVFRLNPEKFDLELKKTSGKIADLTGKKPIGFRAPIFSIIKEHDWAFDVLLNNGFKYDSSIFPTLHYRYGVVSGNRYYHEIEAGQGRTIAEIPVSTMRIMKMNFPIGGGAYFRFWPYFITRWGFRRIIREKRPGVFYMHPWEIDPAQPKIKLPVRLSLTHYTGLKKMEKNLRRLFKDFEFSTIADVFNFEY